MALITHRVGRAGAAVGRGDPALAGAREAEASNNAGDVDNGKQHRRAGARPVAGSPIRHDDTAFDAVLSNVHGAPRVGRRAGQFTEHSG